MNRNQYVLTVALSMIAGMAGGVLGSQLFMGTPLFPRKTPLQVEVIRAERVEVMDKSGNIRALLSLKSNGRLGLGLRDEDEKIRATLGLLPDGRPGLVLRDQDEKRRAVLGLGRDGEPHLSLADKEGIRVTLGHTELEVTRTGGTENRPVSSLVMFDKRGTVIWRAP